MAPELTMNKKRNISVDFSHEKQRLEKFLQSLDSHRYHRILGDAANYPFSLIQRKCIPCVNCRTSIRFMRRMKQQNQKNNWRQYSI